MPVVTATLLTDGSSDRALIPFVERVFDEHCPQPYRMQFVEGLPRGSRTLATRMEKALELFPCDVLLVHRDAENGLVDDRVREIEEARLQIVRPPHVVSIVPVKMLEAWLLVDEAAIRAAVGNPRGRQDLQLPALQRMEQVDAKDVLFRALRAATEYGTQRLRRFDPHDYRHRVADHFENVADLRLLSSFAHFEAQVSRYFSI